MENFSALTIRNLWIKFFTDHNHLLIKSASLVPIDDESLLWINSGIATLKKAFNGEEEPLSKRIVNYQKSLRTNDIENVGITARHHTFFEMLGNFSIGDYFKKEAIEMAFELLTDKKYFNLPLDKLFITIYSDDESAEKLWLKAGIPADHLFKMGRATNFWDVGSGPCGPSTEIFYDRGISYDSRTAKELIENDLENDRFIEIWNIVFSELNNINGNYQQLPQQNIDTGAGLERLAMIFQNTPTNFETDLFAPIIIEISKYTNQKYLWKYQLTDLKTTNQKQFLINANYKKIADYLRATVMALNDNVRPDATGRGYIIRKLIRQAVSCGIELDYQNELNKLVPVIIDANRELYPELIKNTKLIQKIIKVEENNFLASIESGKKRFLEMLKNRKEISDEAIFKLYETYGLPLNIIIAIASKHQLKISIDNFNQSLNTFRDQSRNNQKTVKALDFLQDDFPNLVATKFLGYEQYHCQSKILAIKNDYIVLDQTVFYATSGGQEHDLGTINSVQVTDVFKTKRGVIIHQVPNHNFKINEQVDCNINQSYRLKSAINHSAIHLFFAALEKVLGTEINQAGSKLTDKYFRFDFTTQSIIDWKILNLAQDLANKWVKDDTKTIIKTLPFVEAKKLGINYLNNKNYGEQVRVVILNPEVRDLCGGTHVKNTAEIEVIKIINFEKKGSGIYRVTGITTEATINELEQTTKQQWIKRINDEIAVLPPELNANFDNRFKDLNDLSIDNLKDLLSELTLAKKNYLRNNELKLVNELLKEIKEKIDNDEELVIDCSKINFNLIFKRVISLLDKIDDKIIYLYNQDNNKVSLAIVVSLNLSKKPQIAKEFSTKLSKFSLNGSGSRQLYIYGGKSNLTFKKLISVVKKWQF